MAEVLPFLGIYFKPDADSENIKPIAETFRTRMQNATQAEFGEQAKEFTRTQYANLKRADFSFFENSRHFVFFDDPGKWIEVLKTL